jgi:putative ABC transport system substrate-binding protein
MLMKRREFGAIFVGVVPWPVPSRSQVRPPRIAIFHPSQLRAFFAELERLGFTEGHNVEVERYSGEGRSDRYTELAEHIVGRKPDVDW